MSLWSGWKKRGPEGGIVTGVSEGEVLMLIAWSHLLCSASEMHQHHLSSGTISKRWSATKKRRKWMERQSAVLDISAANLLARSSFSHLSLSGKPFNSKSFNFIRSFGGNDQRFKRGEAELRITSWFALKMFLRFLWPPTEVGGIHGSTIKTFHTLSRSRTLPFLSLPTKGFFFFFLWEPGSSFN